MPHDVIFDIIKPNDAGKMVCPMNIVQNIFIDFLSVSLLEWKYIVDINFVCIVVE